MSILSIFSGCAKVGGAGTAGGGMVTGRPDTVPTAATGNTEGENAKQPEAKFTAPGEKMENGMLLIDYADYPENFMIRLASDTEYILKDGENEVPFSAMTHALMKSGQIMTWGDLTADLSSAVYYRKTEPVLIHLDGIDYIWICEESTPGRLSSVSYYAKNQYGSFNQDNGSVSLGLLNEVLDPSCFAMDRVIDCFGTCCANINYTIEGSYGKPVEIETNDEFYMVSPEYTGYKFYLEDDIKAWVFSDTEAEKPKVTTIPSGTEFRRLRVPINAEYDYVDALLDDGRVMRVIEEYWFSEPTAYQAMLDVDGKQFRYNLVENKGAGEMQGFQGMDINNWGLDNPDVGGANEDGRVEDDWIVE